MKKNDTSNAEAASAGAEKSKNKKVSIIIIGDAAVGKTSILNWYDTRKFNKQHIRTVGLDSVRTSHKTKDGEAELEVKLWDTAGQDRFKNMTYQFYRNADAVIIAFDLTDENSFNAVTGWLQSIFKHKSEEIPKVLCGNKCDLLEVSDGEVVVNDQEAEKIAKENDMQYYKTSAFTGQNIKELINDTIEQVYEKKLKAIIAKEKLEGVSNKKEAFKLNSQSAPASSPQSGSNKCC